MSDTNDSPDATEPPQQANIALPDGWADMDDDAKNEYVASALTKIAQETGVLDPADAEPLADGESNIADEPAADTEVEVETEAVRVFKEPGQE